MESGGQRSVPGAGAEGASGGLRCHACGYQYPHAHPSAKQRRAHRKHCGKAVSAAAVEDGGAGEAGGRVLFPGEGGGAGVGGEGGDGTGASAAECGGGLPGSAQEAGSRPVDGDNPEHYSHDGAGAQAIIDKCAEDREDVASGIAPATNIADDGGTLNEVATQYSEKASPPEEGDPSIPAPTVSSEQIHDVSVPVFPSEPGYVEGFSADLSVSEMQNSNVVSLPSDATGGEISEQTNDLTTEPDGTTVTRVDGMINAIVKDEEKSVTGGDFDSSWQESLQTKVGEGHSNTAVVEDTSDKNLSVVQTEDIPNDELESNQQSMPLVTSSIETVLTTEEPVESGIQVPVGTDDFHLEATDTVKPQEQPDSTSVTEDLAVPEQISIVEGQHFEDGGIQTVSIANVPAVNTEVISVGDEDKNVFSSDETMGDSVLENVTSNTVVPSQADLVELSTCSTAHEINMASSTIDVKEEGQNEKSDSDLTAQEINEVHIKELVEGKQQNEEIVADSITHETNAVCITDNYGENKKETIAEPSSFNIPSTISIEEKKENEVIASPAHEKINVTSNRDVVEENKQSEVDVKTNREIDVVCSTEAIGEKDSTSEINTVNIFDNAEDKKQTEEIGTGGVSDGTSIVSEKKINEDMTEDPSYHEITAVHIPDNVEEKKYQEIAADPTAGSIGVVTDSVEERKDEETTADHTSHGIHATDTYVKEEKGEPILTSTSPQVGAVGSVDDAKVKNEEAQPGFIPGENMPQSTNDAEKWKQSEDDVKEKQNEETAADPIPSENMPQSIDEKRVQSEDAATVPAPEKSEVAQKTNDEKEETAAKEISTVESMDNLKGAGQNEEIADKEVIVDSDRSHVSLKVLLADKNVETKERKPSTKDRVLSFRRRSSKDNESPVKPGSPKAGSGQQDWNSPARLPAEKKSKGKKQQWVPFICCPSIH